MKFSVENASATFDNFLGMTPTKFSGRVDNFVVDLSARGETQTTSHFLALGYRELALSGVAAGEWREKTSEAALEPVAIDAKDMGVAHLTALFGNVSSAAFSPSPLISRAAMLTTSIKSIDLTLEGDGLVDRVLALEAKEQKTSVDKARADYAKAAATAITALGGAGANAKRSRRRGFGLYREAEAPASAFRRAKGRQRDRRAGAKAERNSGKPRRGGERRQVMGERPGAAADRRSANVYCTDSLSLSPFIVSIFTRSRLEQMAPGASLSLADSSKGYFLFDVVVDHTAENFHERRGIPARDNAPARCIARIIDHLRLELKSAFQEALFE